MQLHRNSLNDIGSLESWWFSSLSRSQFTIWYIKHLHYKNWRTVLTDFFPLYQDVIEIQLREIRSKFVLTDYTRARKIVDVTERLEFVREVFVIEDVAVAGCTRFQDLL